MSSDDKTTAPLAQRVAIMASLIIAGEAAFALPFHIARFFRPTLLPVLGMTNSEFVDAQAVYGVTAMLAYFPGGPLADRFQARTLIALSLISTGVGGFWFATFPPASMLWIVFAVWGVTTILCLWAAMIRATREFGGPDGQGRAFGILDGGRGVFAAALGSIVALVFSMMMPDDPAQITHEQRVTAMRAVIYGYTAITFAAGALAWVFIPKSTATITAAQKGFAGAKKRMIAVMKLPTVWLQSTIIVTAYVSYKGFDTFGLFATEVYGFNEVQSTWLTTMVQWLRPIAAVVAGLVGNRVGVSRAVVGCFALLLGCDLYFAIAEPGAAWVLIANGAAICAAMFGLRGLYFALFDEAHVPAAVTGTAVGVISVIGYTPDIFVGVAAAELMERSPGLEGHQHFFWFLAGFSLLGLIATILFQRVAKKSA